MNTLTYDKDSSDGEPCEHLKATHEAMLDLRTRVASCGCCDGIRLECTQCGITLRNVHMGYWGDLAHHVYSTEEMEEGQGSEVSI